MAWRFVSLSLFLSFFAMVGRVCCCRSSDVRSDFKTYKYRDWGVIPLFPPLKICFRDRDCPVPAGFLSRGRICIHLSSSGYWSKGTDICRSSRFFVAPGFSALSRTAEGDMPCRLMIITWVRVLYFAGWTLAARAQPLFRPFGCGPSFRNGPISEKLFYLCQIFCGG